MIHRLFVHDNATNDTQGSSCLPKSAFFYVTRRMEVGDTAKWLYQSHAFLGKDTGETG